MWGRGALDVKSLGIAQLAAMVALAREGTPLRRDVVLVAVADEERGGNEGAGWLLEAHPELLAGVEAVLNEGGFNRVFRGKVLFWGIEVAQKRPLWLRLRASGRAGHASSLNPDSATHRLIRALARVLDRPLRWRVTEPARLFFQALARFDGSGEHGFASRLDEVILPDGPTVALAPGMPTFFLDSLQVTEIETGDVSNAVAPEATASIDARLLPDTDAETFLAEVKAALGSEIEVEVVLSSPPVPTSPVDHSVFRALERALAVRAPVVPAFIGGTTDSRWFRARGIPAYGFSPFAIEPDEARGIHAVDEAISVEELQRGVETMRRVLVALAS
jgi:acetylornithine deacetylase/succinyl-diaminopimelate desuccinylase-like protein